MLLSQVRPLCGYYTRVNTQLEGEKYWRERCTFILTISTCVERISMGSILMSVSKITFFILGG